MRWLTRFGSFLAVFSVLFFIYLALSRPHAFDQIPINSHTFASLLMAVGIYTCAALIGGGLVWFVLLRSVKQSIQFITAVTLVFLSQAAKYIPGNVAHHIGRVVLARKCGLSTSAVLFTMFMETTWAIAVAVLLALAAVLFSDGLFVDVDLIPEWWMMVVLLVATMLLPAAGYHAFKYVALWWSSRHGGSLNQFPMPSMGSVVFVAVLYVINFLTLGIVLNVILYRLLGVSDNNLLILTGTFAVAWVVGFIMPGAPAGLGVREIVLVASLTGIYGNDVSIAVAGILRVVSVLGDLLAFVIGILLKKFSCRSTEEYN